MIDTGGRQTAARAAPRGRSLRFWLWWLALACAAPAWVVVALSLVVSYDRDSEMLEAGAIATARALTQAIDGKLRSVESALEVLAASPWFASGDFAPLHAQAQRIITDMPAEALVVRRRDGGYVMHSGMPYGDPLPRSNAPELVRRVFETGQPIISNLFRGSASGSIIVAVEAPVRVGDEVAYSMGLAISANQLGDIIRRQAIPKNWVAVVVDRVGTIAAHSKDADSFVGAKVDPMLWRQIMADSEGTADVVGPNGEELLNSYSRSATSGWSVVIGVPKAELEGELRRSMWLTGGAAACLMLLALLFAWFVGKRISASIEALQQPAMALGFDRPIQIAPSPIAEVNAIGRALETASQLLRQRLKEREQAFLEQHLMLAEKEAAEQASRARSQFLAMMSHEIRTPMNGVMALAELLADSRLDLGQQEMVRTIQQAGEDLLSIINDILNYSKIEAGQIALEQIPCSPRRLIDGAAALMRPKAQAKGLGFSVTIDPATPEWVLGDPTRLRQVMLNSILNAIKFTDSGRVTIDLRGDGETLRFDVRDTGVGMTPEEIKRLFKPFAQADESISRRFGGAGLGLSISLGLVSLMKGHIGVESEAGEGSRFWFELPAPPCPAPSEADFPDAAPRAFWSAAPRALVEAENAMILCVEDNRTNQTVLSLVMQRLGLQFDMASDGAAALNALTERRYGLLITDYHMPEIDGLELARLIRAREAATGGPRMPILALTADAIEGVEGRCRAAGMDGYALKPITLAKLEAWVTRLLPAAIALRRPDMLADAFSPTTQGRDAPALNIHTLTEMIGHDPEAIRAILADFAASAADLAAQVKAALPNAPDEARRAAHSLKSAARYAGAVALGDLAAAVEAALARDAAAAAAEIAERLEPAHAALLTEIAMLYRE